MRLVTFLLIATSFTLLTVNESYATIDCEKDLAKLSAIQQAWCKRKARLKSENKIDKLYGSVTTDKDGNVPESDEDTAPPKSFWGLEDKIKQNLEATYGKKEEKDEDDEEDDEEEVIKEKVKEEKAVEKSKVEETSNDEGEDEDETSEE